MRIDMKTIALLMILVFLFSCDKNENKETPTETPIDKFQILTSKDWHLSHTEICDVIELSPMGDQKYVFNSDSTYTYFYGTFFWKEMGNWLLVEAQNTISLEYKIITWDTSGINYKTLNIHNLTENIFIIRQLYNDTTYTGQFCEYAYKYYKP